MSVARLCDVDRTAPHPDTILQRVRRPKVLLEQRCKTYPLQRSVAGSDATRIEVDWALIVLEQLFFGAAGFGTCFRRGSRDVDSLHKISRNAGTGRWPKPTRRTTRPQASRTPSWHQTPLSTGQNRTDR